LPNISYGTEVSIELQRDHAFHAISLVYSANPKKHYGFLALYGVWFDKEMIAKSMAIAQNNCNHEKHLCSEIRVIHSPFPVIHICCNCGQIWICDCFKGLFETNELIKDLPWGDSYSELRATLKGHLFVPNLCCFCNNSVPPFIYGHEMYYNTFLQRYLPYYNLMLRKFRQDNPSKCIDDEVSRCIENATRKHFEYPAIGEQWISETVLFKIVQTLFSPVPVIHHYRGKELEGLELDIWIPDRKIGKLNTKGNNIMK
jgi:hypothetical protein